MRNKKYQQSGFTIIEMLVVSVMMVVLAGAIFGLNYIIGQSQSFAFRSFMTVDQTNASVTMMVKELRTAQYGDNGAYPVELADYQNIVFYSDIDVDGDSEKVRYYLDGTELMKTVTEPTGVPPQYLPSNEITKSVASNVRNGGSPLFYYFNANYPSDTQNNPMTYPASIAGVRMVQIVLRINADESKPSSDYILDSFTNIRLLKDNL
jgi:prepilin-type N-terminal cleavage/methylation domain-containing protein